MRRLRFPTASRRASGWCARSAIAAALVWSAGCGMIVIEPIRVQESERPLPEDARAGEALRRYEDLAFHANEAAATAREELRRRAADEGWDAVTNLGFTGVGFDFYERAWLGGVLIECSFFPAGAPREPRAAWSVKRLARFHSSEQGHWRFDEFDEHGPQESGPGEDDSGHAAADAAPADRALRDAQARQFRALVDQAFLEAARLHAPEWYGAVDGDR